MIHCSIEIAQVLIDHAQVGQCVTFGLSILNFGGDQMRLVKVDPCLFQIALPPATSSEAQRIYREMEQKLAFNPRQNLGV